MRVAVVLAALAAIAMAAPAILASVYLISDGSGHADQAEIFGVNYTLPMAPIVSAVLLGLGAVLAAVAIRDRGDASH